MKVDKSIEIPMTIGVILQGLGFIIYLICIFTQRSFYPSKHKYNGTYCTI